MYKLTLRVRTPFALTMNKINNYGLVRLSKLCQNLHDEYSDKTIFTFSLILAWHVLKYKRGNNLRYGKQIMNATLKLKCCGVRIGLCLVAEQCNVIVYCYVTSVWPIMLYFRAQYNTHCILLFTSRPSGLKIYYKL